LNKNFGKINHAKGPCWDIVQCARSMEAIIVEAKRTNFDLASQTEFVRTLNDAKNYFDEIMGQYWNPAWWRCGGKGRVEPGLKTLLDDMLKITASLNATLNLQQLPSLHFCVKDDVDYDKNSNVNEEKTDMDQPNVAIGVTPGPRDLQQGVDSNKLPNEVFRAEYHAKCQEDAEMKKMKALLDYQEAISFAFEMQEFFNYYETQYLEIFKRWYEDAETLPSREAELEEKLALQQEGLKQFNDQGLGAMLPDAVKLKEKNLKQVKDQLAKVQKFKKDLVTFHKKRGDLNHFKAMLKNKIDVFLWKVGNMPLEKHEQKRLNDNIPQLKLCEDRKSGDFLKIQSYTAKKLSLESSVNAIVSDRRLKYQQLLPSTTIVPIDPIAVSREVDNKLMDRNLANQLIQIVVAALEKHGDSKINVSNKLNAEMPNDEATAEDEERKM